MFRSRSLLALVAPALLYACASVDVRSTLGQVHDAHTLEAALTQMTTWNVAPTVLVTVVGRGRTLYQGHFGEVPSHDSSDVNAIGFNVWSISKIVTSLTVLQLDAAGVLDLDAPIGRYDARFFDSKNSRHVTARQLLNHTAGIPDIGMALYAQTVFDGAPPISQRALADRLLPDPRLWRPDTAAARYSNSHYLLLAALIESATDLPFQRVAAQSVLSPLHMAHTGYRYAPGQIRLPGSHPADFTSLLAFFYVDKRRAVASRADGRYRFNAVYNNSLGSTGLVSTTADMATLMVTLLDCLNDRPVPLSAVGCHAYRDAGVTVRDSPAGRIAGLTQRLGWFVAPTPLGISYAHGGAGMGFTSMLRLYPELDLGIFVVANDSYFDGHGGSATVDAISRVAW